jgi:hypothetical protein
MVLQETQVLKEMQEQMVNIGVVEIALEVQLVQ